MWRVPKIWKGGDVWIVGGGPSIAEQFNIPSEVVDEVKVGAPISKFSPFMEPIHRKHVIGINVAFMIGNWIDIAFFGDKQFYLRWGEELYQFKHIVASCSPYTTKFPWFKTLGQDKDHIYGISKKPGMVSWNQNSGAAAISLAAQAGAKRIFLLGFDMKLNGGGQQHFHGLYLSPKERAAKKIDVRERGLPFKRHLVGFGPIAADAKQLGIEIINVSPGSAITEFPKVSLKDCL